MKGCRPLSDSEIQAVLNAFHGTHSIRDRAWFTLGVYTGFRISEILSVRVHQVWQYGRVFDSLTVPPRFRKGGKNKEKRQLDSHTVKLHAKAKQAIIDLLQSDHFEPGDPLFKSQKGGQLTRTAAWRVLDKVFDHLEMTGKLATHTMRKTFAARVYAAVGKELIKLKAAMGHMEISSTAKYLSFEDEEVDAAVLGVE